MAGLGGLSKMGAMPAMEKKPAAAGRMGGESKMEAGKQEGEGEVVHELHDHGDGTFHSVSGGETMDHPDGHHALAHVAHKMMGGGAHFHAHHDGLGMHSHSISEGGEHSETKEHESPEEMHSAMDAAMGGGGEGPAHAAGGEEPGGGAMLGGFRG
jgi:hypothetical protein